MEQSGFVASCGCESWVEDETMRLARPCAEHYAAQLAAKDAEIARLGELLAWLGGRLGGADCDEECIPTQEQFEAAIVRYMNFRSAAALEEEDMAIIRTIGSAPPELHYGLRHAAAMLRSRAAALRALMETPHA